MAPADPTPAKRAYQLAAAEQPGVIVRYKAGYESRAQLVGFQGTGLAGLGRAYRYHVPDAAKRAQLYQAMAADPAVEYVEPDYTLHTFALPTDPYVANQWDLPKIQLGQALDLTKGDPSVIIASVDSGVDYNHADLAGQVIKGYDYANNDADPLDDNGHGTHTAGTMAALTNNATGVAGIAGGCKILAVKVMDSSGAGSTSGIADGINYAVSHGAKVINLSLGGPSDSQTLHAAIQQAVNAGVLVVAAAGNDGTTTMNYPAAYSEVISVGATDKTDARASYSQYGSWVSIAAPGSSILSTYKGGQYATMDGTSMASPHVSAVAALVRSLHPTWSVSQVRQALVTTGDPCTGFESAPALRRLNAYKALQYGSTTTSPTPAPTVAPTAAPTPAPTATPAPVTLSITSSSTSTTSSSATFKWTTNVAADSQVELVNLNWSTPVFTTMATSHQVTISGLQRYTYYSYRLHSKDAAGHAVVSPLYYVRTSYY
jgi:thermitase